VAKKILVLGDTHFPYCSSKSLEQIYSYVSKNTPNVIVQLGDLYDMFSMSKFPRSYVTSPSEEVKRGREMAEDMWTVLTNICPRAKRYQLKGNHDIRPLSRLIEKSPELEVFYDDSFLWRFNRVKTIHDVRDELILDDIVFLHGYRSRLGEQAKYRGKSCVVAHTHRGGVHFINKGDELIWELNVGYLGDVTSKVFNYTKQKFTQWTLGFGWIDGWGPRFCPIG